MSAADRPPRAKLSPQEEERLARYRAGGMTDGDRAAFEREAVATEALSEALYREEALDALGSEPAGRARVLDARPALRYRALRAALPAAASVAILVALWSWTLDRGPGLPGDDAVRGASAEVHLLAPVGALDRAPEAFSWSSDPGAATYRVDLFTPEGKRLGTAVTQDTVIAVSAVSTESVPAGEWRVTPIGADGLERTGTRRTAFHVRER